LEGDEGVDPLAYLEELDEAEAAADPARLAAQGLGAEADGLEDEEFEDYGELTEGDEADALEDKQI
jgi:hypothetical protein